MRRDSRNFRHRQFGLLQQLMCLGKAIRKILARDADAQMALEMSL